MDLEYPNIFIFSAPSGAGKTTIVHAALARFKNLSFSISATTRPARSHEVNGEHYHFLTQNDFKEKIKKGEFLEWEEVYSGRFYGTLLKDVEQIIQSGKHPIFDVDVQGGINIKKHYGSRAVSFFIKPPSVDILRERLKLRATEPQAEIDKRVAKAKSELTYAPQFDHIILNDFLEEAIDHLSEILEGYGLEKRR